MGVSTAATIERLASVDVLAIFSGRVGGGILVFLASPVRIYLSWQREWIGGTVSIPRCLLEEKPAGRRLLA